MKIKHLVQYLFCFLTTSCQNFLIVPDDPSYNAICAYSDELKKNYDLRIVGFGAGTKEGVEKLEFTLLGPQTPSISEARLIFYDVSTRFLERINLNQKLCEVTGFGYYTIDNLKIMIIFPDVENCVVTIANGYKAGQGNTQFVFFFTYDATSGKTAITYEESYEELKSIVEQQRCCSQQPQ